MLKSGVMEMDVLDLPPPAEPIDPSIGLTVFPKPKGQPTQTIEMKLGAKPKTNNMTKEKKTKSSTKQNQWKVSKEDNALDNTENEHKHGKKKKKKKKKGKEEKKDIAQEKRSHQTVALIPYYIDYEKLAAAEMNCSDITHPKYKKPFDYGWRRELVFRATVQEDAKKLGDVYYYTPDGFRLRSMVELARVELQNGLTLDNFSFFPEPTGVNNLWKETIRAAVFRDKGAIAQTRQEVREGLKNVKRKLASTQKSMKRRRTYLSYLDREGSKDFDEDMADEIAMTLCHMKPEKVHSQVRTEKDGTNELLMIKQEKVESQSQEPKKLPDIVIKKEKDDTQIQAFIQDVESNKKLESQSQEPKKLPEIIVTTDKGLLQGFQEVPSNKWPDIVIKKEKDTQTQPCVRDQESNEFIITNVRTQVEEFVGESQPISTPNKVIEKVVDETLHKEDLGSAALPEKNKTVTTCDEAVQTLSLNDYKEKDMLIDRLQMENMFLKEKLANLEKWISSSRIGNSHRKLSDSSASREVINKESENKKTQSDCDVICVNQVVMNIEYETIDLDSD